MGRETALEDVYNLAKEWVDAVSSTDYPELDPYVQKALSALAARVHEVEDSGDLKKDELRTVLSHKESLAVKESVRLALRAERHRLQYYATINDDDFAVDSALLKKLNLAFEIMRLREQPAEEMGKY